MSALILDGKTLAAQTEAELSNRVAKLKEQVRHSGISAVW